MYSPSAALAGKVLTRPITAIAPPVVRVVTPNHPGKPAQECPATASAISRTSLCTLLAAFTPAAFTLFVRPTKQTEFCDQNLGTRFSRCGTLLPRHLFAKSWRWSIRKPRRARAQLHSHKLAGQSERAAARPTPASTSTTSPPAPTPCLAITPGHRRSIAALPDPRASAF